MMLSLGILCLKAWRVQPPGVIGLELGQALHRLGVKVGIFGVGGAIGGISDPVVAEEAKAVFGEELALHLDAKPKSNWMRKAMLKFIGNKTAKKGVRLPNICGSRRPSSECR